jgi:hypothetical protein
VLESGAGFVSPTEFAARQKLLRDYFDLRVETPRELWRRKSEDTTVLAHRPVRGKRLDRHEPVPYVCARIQLNSHPLRAGEIEWAIACHSERSRARAGLPATAELNL